MSAGRRFGRDLELEESLAAWLAEGPEIAPTTVVDDAIEAVDRRPRRPWSGLQVRSRDVLVRTRPGATARRLAWAALIAAALLLAGAWAALVLSDRPSPEPLPARMNGLLAVAVGGEIVLVDPNGHRIEVVPAAGEERSDPVWSSDGRYLAVRVRTVADGAYRVDLLEPDGTLARTILGPVAWVAPGLAWSADGRWLAAATGVPGAESIVVVSTDTWEARPLSGATGTRPAFAPTGDLVAFVGHDGPGTPGLLVSGLEAGARPRRLLERADAGSISSPAWTPDGTTVVVIAPAAGAGAATRALLSVPAAGGPTLTLREVGREITVAPTVLPNGRIVVVTNGGAAIVDPRTGQATPADPSAASGTAEPRAVAISPDGRRIAVLLPGACDGSACRPDRLMTLATAPDGTVHRVTGSLPVRLTPSDPDGWSIAWQPLVRPDRTVTATDTQNCSTQAAGTRSGPTDRERWEGVVVTCSTQASDPRVSGTFTLTMTIQMAPDGSASLSGTSEMTNPDGTWIGEFAGTVAAGYTDHDIRATLVGTGSYAGLRARLHVTGVGPFTSEIAIEPVEE
jgi:hypothetical protein